MSKTEKEKEAEAMAEHLENIGLIPYFRSNLLAGMDPDRALAEAYRMYKDICKEMSERKTERSQRVYAELYERVKSRLGR